MMSIRRVVPDIKSERFGESKDFYVGLLGFEVVMDTECAQVSVMKRGATANVAPDASTRGSRRRERVCTSTATRR